MRDTQPQSKAGRPEGQESPAPSMKFPRTPHLAGPGRPATPDDVILSEGETEALLQGGHRIVLEEKIDGANIGLSLDASSGRICVQNRSHVADIEGSAQFSKMKGWLEQKKAELYAVLSQGLVLYGEWLQVRHTVAYDALPDWFVAFDLYSLADAKFLSTHARDALLKEHAPSIARIREVPHDGAAGTRQALLALLVKTRSAYRLDGGTPEGLYLRVEHGGFLHMRAKLVDPEFKQAIEASGHWMHKARQANAVRPDLWEDAEAALDDEHPHAAVPHESWEARNAAVERLLAEAQAKGRQGDYPTALDLSVRALCMARAIITQDPAANVRRAHGMLRAHSLGAQALFGLGRTAEARDSFSACAAMLGDADCGDEALCAGLRSKCERGLAECERLLEEGSVSLRLSNPRERVLVKTASRGDVLLMRNTSWLVPNQILSGSTPKSKEHISALSEACKVSLVVTLTEEEPLKRGWFTGVGAIRNLFFPVPNYCPPSMDQMKAILHCMEDEVAAGGRVFVHCGGGKGRAGTVNACWLVKHGLEAYAADACEGMPKMCGEEAVRVLRDMRPGSIETERQERFVSELCAELWRLFDAAPAEGGPAPTRTAQHKAAPACQSPASSSHTPAVSGAATLDEHAALALSGGKGSQEAAHPPQYPRTPHIDFSPGVASDDVTMPEGRSLRFVRSRVVVTEKLDGGNCCVCDGRVYARTHAHEARAPWFSAAKAKAAELKAFSLVPTHVVLFLENMQAIHSIDYGCLSHPMYVIGALDIVANEVLSWEETVGLAERAGLPTVPVVYDGEFESRDRMQSWMQEQMKCRSCVGGGSAEKEGFVVRIRDAFPLAAKEVTPAHQIVENFSDCCAKYVRRGHVQTDANFRLTWRQATWSSTMNQGATADSMSAAACNAPPTGSSPVEIDVVRQECKEDVHSPTAAAGGEREGRALAVIGKKSASHKKGAKAKVCSPKFVMLVGMPGSGKSTFWNLLKEGMKDGSDMYVRVSQDELGSRGACEDAVGTVLGGRGTGQGVVLDRCNCAVADRATWLALAMQSPKQCVCVFFDFDQGTCTKRVAARTDHPTIPFGRGGRAVASHAKLLEVPTTQEGFKTVYRVTSADDARRVASLILSRN